MKIRTICALLLAATMASAADPVAVVTPRTDLSLKFEVENAIAKGLKWLEKKQAADGSWSQPEVPALSALVLTSFMGAPSGAYRAEKPEFIQKGYLYLLRNVQPDGGIYVKPSQVPALENYNTAVCTTALVVARDKTYEPVIRKARNYLVGLQNEGGVGYNKTGRTDLSNTVFALEAVYYSKHLAKDVDPKAEPMKELDWKAATEFIQNCQNLPEYNKNAWASDDPKNKGGFSYSQYESKAGEEKLASGKTALRSYGSMSYAGLLSYIYADLAKDDPRVKAVLGWLGANYTLDENPGMGQEGLYYYFHTLAKALSAAGVDRLKLADGREADWRRDLAVRLMSLQNGEQGFWQNDNGRWWEKDPVLSTSYALIALEILYRGL